MFVRATIPMSKQTMQTGCNMLRTQALMAAFGWQGGTIHQLAEVTGCSANDLLYSDSQQHSLEWQGGFCSYRTCSKEFINERDFIGRFKGNLQYWLGVADAVNTTEKLGEQINKKF